MPDKEKPQLLWVGVQEKDKRHGTYHPATLHTCPPTWPQDGDSPGTGHFTVKDVVQLTADQKSGLLMDVAQVCPGEARTVGRGVRASP